MRGIYFSNESLQIIRQVTHTHKYIKIGNYIRERYLPRSSAPPCEKNSLERTHPETYIVEIRLTSNLTRISCFCGTPQSTSTFPTNHEAINGEYIVSMLILNSPI